MMKTSTEILYRSDFTDGFFDYLLDTLHDGKGCTKNMHEIEELTIKMEFVEMHDDEGNVYY